MEAENELSGGNNLYWRSCPVLVKRGERSEERTSDLTIRLIATGQKHGQRALRLFLSSEADPYFLHLLEVGEEDYALLRSDQGIRVDFANFPGQLIGLLDKCIACKAEDLPRFQAVLHTPAAQAQGSLRVLENNDFKQLPHITLALRPGSDAAVKQWLAFRLGELRSDASQLSAELERTQSERNSLQGSLAEARRALADSQEQHERFALEHAADAKAREAALLEAKSRELADVREAAARDRAQLEARQREALEAATSRAADLEAEARALREQKCGLDARVSELSHKLGAAEGKNRSLGEEVEQLRASSAALGRAKAERDVELGEALVKIAALEDKVAGQQGLAAEQAQRLKDMEASLRQVEARAAELKEAAVGHEARGAEAAAELGKANTLLEKMTNDLQLQKEKARRKAGIAARQEEELAARDRAADEAGQRVRGLQRDLERANEDAEGLRKEVADLRDKLEEARAAAASNEQMIRWLNSQITETQLHYGGGAGPALLASRYSFRTGGAGPPPAGPIGGSATSAGPVAAGGAVPMGPGTSIPALRPGPSIYRTAIVPGASASGLASGAALASAGTSAAPQPSSVGGSSGALRRGPFRSNFYATHFGGGAGSSGAGHLPASSLPSSAAGGLNLGSTAAAEQAAGSIAADVTMPATANSGAPAGAGGGGASMPAAPSGMAGLPLANGLEAPTYRTTAALGGSMPARVMTSAA